jgi:quercetin dioxygenase-like cupin family protein
MSRKNLFPGKIALAAAVSLASLPWRAWAQESPGANTMITISGANEHNHSTGSATYFTGSVQVQPLFGAHDQSAMTGGQVTFAPGARSAWHTHPRGQILIVTDGTGWVQQWGGPTQVMRKGDVVWIPAGVKHWHGATSTSSVTHLALQEEVNGKNVNWLEKVSDEQYRNKP